MIVVDNASSDRTVEELERARAQFDDMYILPQSENTGFAKGNNIGFHKARELGVQYALLLNQDMEVTPQWLSPLFSVMETRPDVAAAQPLIVLHGEPDRVNSAGNALHFCGFGYCGSYRASLPQPHDSGIRSVAFASGAALMLRMSALSRTGDFDERLFMYHEDADLQIRLRQLGYDCVVVPTSVVSHKYTPGFSTRKYALLDRNRWLVLLKDWPRSRLLLSAPALAGIEVAVWVFAAEQGWWKEKWGNYMEVLRTLPEIVRTRGEVQRQRVSGSSDALHLTGVIQFEGFDHPLITAVANPVLSAYWAVVRRFVD